MARHRAHDVDLLGRARRDEADLLRLKLLRVADDVRRHVLGAQRAVGDGDRDANVGRILKVQIELAQRHNDRVLVRLWLNEKVCAPIARPKRGAQEQMQNDRRENLPDP